MKAYFVKTVREYKIDFMGIFFADNLDDLYWGVDSFLDPNCCEYSPKVHIMNGVMFKKTGINDEDVEEVGIINTYEVDEKNTLNWDLTNAANSSEGWKPIPNPYLAKK